MPIINPYNKNPVTVDSLLRKQQMEGDIKSSPLPVETPQNPKVLGVEITPDSPDKSFLRKVGEDAAMLSYAVPVGLAQAVTHPINFIKGAISNESGDVTRGAIGQSVRDVVDPEYYKAHPLLGVVNLLGFASPIAGVAKSIALKTATRGALSLALKEATTAGLKEETLNSVLGGNIIKEAVNSVAKTGNSGIVSETIRGALVKAGATEDVAFKIGNTVADNVLQTLSRQTTKMKVLDSISHPVGALSKGISPAVEPIQRLIFGSPAKTAVAKIYGADVVAKHPDEFLGIERWAEAQTAERGLTNTVANRQRVMNEWTEQNSQWASLTPEERIAHFKNYAEQDLLRLKLHQETGIDVVTTKALPQNYVDSMVETIKNAPKDISDNDLVALMQDTFGNDFNIHSAEIETAIKGSGNFREGMINAISKLGNSRSLVSFNKFSPEIQQLVKDIEGTGYRIASAPTNKAVSFVSDVFSVGKKTASSIADTDIQATRNAIGSFIEKLGLSPEGVIEGAPEYTYRQNFTQKVLNEMVPKYGNIFEAKSVNHAGKVSIPAEKLFQWLDKNKAIIRGTSSKGAKEFFSPARTVFDLKEPDLLRAGFSPEVARDLQRISNNSLREVPTSIIGAADKIVNYIKTTDKGFGKWLTSWYDPYLKVAYKFRYDLSPFFAAQQWLETKINSSILTKDMSLLPGGKAITESKFGRWTADALARRLDNTKSYLPKIVGEPTLNEQVLVRDEVLGTLQKTMLDYTSSPDIINITSAAKKVEGLAGEAAFQRSIQSRNFWFAMFGESSVRMATQVNKALAEKFGMTIEQALDYTIEGGNKVYKNPQMVNMLRDITQDVFHYKQGFLTSPLVKTMNVVWFPFRFQAKTMELAGEWLGSLSPVKRLAIVNNWVHFANWAGTDEGIEWRKTNRNLFYQILNYSLAYGQIGQSIEAVTKGRIFGGNTGLIGGVPFGFMVNLARELAYLPSDTDQYDPKTGKEFKKQTPKDIPSVAALSVALEQLVIQVLPGMPFYTLTGGVISGVSPRGWATKLIRMGIGGAKEYVSGGDPTQGYQKLQRDFKRVPLDYNRLAE